MQLQKIELPHRNNLRIPSTGAKQPSYKTPLDAYFENIASNECKGGFTTQSYIQDVLFTKLDNGLNSTIYAKIFTLDA